MLADTNDDTPLPCLIKLPVRVKNRGPNRPVASGEMCTASFEDVRRALAQRLIKIGANAGERWCAKGPKSTGAEQRQGSQADDWLGPPSKQGRNGDGGQYRQCGMKHYK